MPGFIMARPTGIPGYLHHKSSKRAYVRLNGTDVYLGFYGTKESKKEYNRVISEWLANNKQLPASSGKQAPITVNGICVAFLKYAKVYYRKEGRLTAEYSEYEVACRLLFDHCGMIPASEFTRKTLKTIREEISQRGWKRGTVNARIKRIKRLFRWAAEEEELIPASVYHELKILGGLKKGRSVCPESKRVRPVPLDIYEKTLEFCPPIVADMARLQYLTGMRPRANASKYLLNQEIFLLN